MHSILIGHGVLIPHRVLSTARVVKPHGVLRPYEHVHGGARMDIDMHIDMCIGMHIDLYIDTAIDMRMDMCMGMCMNMCLDVLIDMGRDMHTDMCIDMGVDMSIDTGMKMCTDMRMDTCIDVCIDMSWTCVWTTWPASPQKVQFKPGVSLPTMLRALLAVVQEGDGDSVNLLCRHDGSLCKAAACIHERSASCHCQYGLRGMRKKMREEGRVGARAKQGHPCMQRSKNLRYSGGESECRSQPGPCVAARSAGLCVAPARNNTPPALERNLHSSEGQTRRKPATRHGHSMPLYRKTANADKFAGRGKIKAGLFPSRQSAEVGKNLHAQLNAIG